MENIIKILADENNLEDYYWQCTSCGAYSPTQTGITHYTNCEKQEGN